MKRFFFGVFFCFGIPLSVQATTPVAFPFLGISPSARGAALGEAMTAASGDASAAFWNPALLANLKGGSFTAQENFFLQGNDHTFLGFGLRTNKLGLGASLNFNHTGDLEARVGPSTQPLGTFSENEAALSGSGAYQITPKLAAGITAKVLYQKLDVYDNFGAAFDLGAVYEIQQKIRAGASVLNAGPDFTLVSEGSRLPMAFRAGVSFFWRDFLFLSDAVFPRGGNAKTGWGVERQFRNLFLRAGYQTGYDEKNFSFGMGVLYRKFRLDYAFVPYQSDLGSAHRFGIVADL